MWESIKEFFKAPRQLSNGGIVIPKGAKRPPPPKPMHVRRAFDDNSMYVVETDGGASKTVSGSYLNSKAREISSASIYELKCA